MKGIVISVFPGLGKTTVSKRYPSIYDLQTSPFRRDQSNVKDVEGYEKDKGFGSNITNPNFPQNYLDALEEKRQENDIVLVTGAQDIRELLETEGIPFIFVLPEQTEKYRQKLIERYKSRNNTEAFIDVAMEYFDTLSRNQKDYKCKTLIANENEFLEDLLLRENIL